MSRAKILIIAFSDLSKDPRVQRQYCALRNEFEISTIGLKSISSNVPNYLNSYIRNSFSLKLYRGFLSIFGLISLYHKIVKLQYNLNKDIYIESFDLILCNDVDALPLGFSLAAKGIPVWADLHEFSPAEFENSLMWRLYYKKYKKWLSKRFLPKCQFVSVVNKGIGELYLSEFGIRYNAVINNAPYFEPALNPTTNFGAIRIIHHGAAIKTRKLENMIAMMAYLPKDYSLYFLLAAEGKGQLGYLNYLKKYAADKDLSNVYFENSIPTEMIPSYINQFDIGLYILKPTNPNDLYALPNKFFEFIQARLCLAISPNPEMAEIVQKFGLGVVASGFSAKDMANQIIKLNREDIQKFKNNSDENARRLSAEQNLIDMLQVVKKLVA